MELHEELDAVTRELLLAAPRPQAWALLSDPCELERWLADEIDLDRVAPGERGSARVEGELRRLVVEEVEHERRVSLRWWADGDDEGDATLVELTLDDDEGGTRLLVTELPVRVLDAVASRFVAPAAVPRGPQLVAACA